MLIPGLRRERRGCSFRLCDRHDFWVIPAYALPYISSVVITGHILEIVLGVGTIMDVGTFVAETKEKLPNVRVVKLQVKMNLYVRRMLRLCRELESGEDSTCPLVDWAKVAALPGLQRVEVSMYNVTEDVHLEQARLRQLIMEVAAALGRTVEVVARVY